MKIIFLIIAILNFAAFIAYRDLVNAFWMVLMIWMAIVWAIDESNNSNNK